MIDSCLLLCICMRLAQNMHFTIHQSNSKVDIVHAHAASLLCVVPLSKNDACDHVIHELEAVLMFFSWS